MSPTWSWLGQYLIFILLIFLLSTLLASSPSLKQIFLQRGGLDFPHAVRLLGGTIILLIVWRLFFRAAGQLSEDGAGSSFLRAVLRPLTTIMILLLGNQIFLTLGTPLVDLVGRSLYQWSFFGGLLLATFSLTIAWIGTSEALTAFIDGQSQVSALPLSGTAKWTTLDPTGLKTGPGGTVILKNGRARATLGRYKIIKELGRGAMGVVYLGRDPTIQRFVAIKTMRLDDVEDPSEVKEIKERFFREAESTGRLLHPNIVIIYDAGEEEDLGYIAMELLEGTTLTHWCREEKLLPVLQVVDIVTSVAEALDYAHSQGVVHRDIKPANIMLIGDRKVKVMDFGIAKLTLSTKTRTSVIQGTPSYMSPEQAMGHSVDGRSDIFSLGAVFFELLTGRKAFTAEHLSALMFKIATDPHPPLTKVRPDLPACLEAIVDRALQKEPPHRYRLASDMAQDLRACLKGLSS
jgi:eukaryotic-like serine/threonine-protein kinase